MGPVACLSPFSVIPWKRSDKGPKLRSYILMLLMSRIKVPNKSLSRELNNVVNGMVVTILTSLNETNVHCYLSMEYLRNW